MRILPRRKQAWLFAINNLVDRTKSYSRLHDADIRVYHEAGNAIERYRVKQKAATRRSTTAHCFGWLTGLAIIQHGLRRGFAHF